MKKVYNACNVTIVAMIKKMKPVYGIQVNLWDNKNFTPGLHV